MTAPAPTLPVGPSDVPPLAGRREWIGLSVLALACLLYVMDLTVLHLAVPAISEDLQPTSTQLLWIIDIYGFMVAGFLVTMGTLGDRIGRRKVLLIGAAAFGVTSVAAAFSTTAEMLIISRAALGIAGATIAPSTLSLIFSMFRDPRQRSLAVGVWISAFSAGSAVGPVIGGVLLEHFAWGSVFLLALPVMVALLILGPIVLPEYKDPDAGRLDLLSAGLSLVAVLSVVFGLKQAAMEGFTTTAIGAIALGLAVGLAFVRRQLRLKDPMLDLSLFRIPAFSASLAVNFLTVFVAIGYFLFVAQYLQLVLGLSPFQAGIWSVPSAIGFIVGSNLAPRLLGGVRPAYLIAGCLGVASVGLLILAQAGAAEGLVPVVVASVVISLGLAPVFGLTTELIVGSAPPEKAGAASGVSETGSELGGALGISILGSIGLAVYRGQTDGALPAGLPEDAVAVAVDTLGGAVSVAAELPAAVADQVLAVARGAYVDGMQLVALISVVLAAGVAAFALLALRGIQRPDGGETGGGHGAAAGPDDDARPVITAVPAPEG
jgi:DHA2 family multidrug resistance protein-like MFS transporter